MCFYFSGQTDSHVERLAKDYFFFFYHFDYILLDPRKSQTLRGNKPEDVRVMDQYCALDVPSLKPQAKNNKN